MLPCQQAQLIYYTVCQASEDMRKSVLLDGISLLLDSTATIDLLLVQRLQCAVSSQTFAEL